MVSIVVFVIPGTKVNGQYYHDVLLSQQMLPAIKHVDNAPSDRAKDIIKQLHQETPDFTGPDLWPPNSPDLNLCIIRCGVFSSRVYECHMISVDELKQCHIDVWNSLQQNVINAAINEWKSNWEHACMQMDNILDIYRERVWLTKNVMDK